MARKKNTPQRAKQIISLIKENLPKQRKKLLELAKEELRIIFGR